MSCCRSLRQAELADDAVDGSAADRSDGRHGTGCRVHGHTGEVDR